MTHHTELQGVKHDGGKVRLDLIPPELMQSVGEILTFGADKYDDHNWELGMDWSRVFGALQRHLYQWYDTSQPDTDEETGKSHLWHAACCITFLLTYEKRQKGHDDRFRYDDLTVRDEPLRGVPTIGG